MEKRREVEDPNSALNKAAPDEPVFVLRAKDPLFGQVVRYWAFLAEQGRVHEAEKLRAAVDIAQDGDDWRLRNVLERQRQRAIAPDAEPETSSEIVRDCPAHVDRMHRFTTHVIARDDYQCACGAFHRELVEARS